MQSRRQQPMDVPDGVDAEPRRVSDAVPRSVRGQQPAVAVQNVPERPRRPPHRMLRRRRRVGQRRPFTHAGRVPRPGSPPGRSHVQLSFLVLVNRIAMEIPPDCSQAFPAVFFRFFSLYTGRPINWTVESKWNCHRDPSDSNFFLGKSICFRQAFLFK